MRADEDTWTITYKDKHNIDNQSPQAKSQKLSAMPVKCDLPKRVLFSDLDDKRAYRDCGACTPLEYVSEQLCIQQESAKPEMVDCSVDTSTLSATNTNSLSKEECQLVGELCNLFPCVVDFLASQGKLDKWAMVFRLMKNGQFPADNIAVELFLDVVTWHSLDNPLQMRHSSKKKKKKKQLLVLGA